MELKRRCFALLAMLLFNSQPISSKCPSVYLMVDKQHSYCADKKSLQSIPPTAKDIEVILEIHNQERLAVNAKQMQKMYWNTDLAEIAQSYAEHCNFVHDTSSEREAPRIPLSTGQNLALGYQSWTEALRGWADEKKDFIYGSSVQNGVVGHYTQMVKDTAALVGCGLAICPKSAGGSPIDWPHYVCNYVTGQVGDNKPYIPASTSGSNNKAMHDCRGLVCLYSGTLDLHSCECQCPSYTSGKQCEVLDCSSLSDSCPYGNDKSLCKTYANVPPECPKFCGLCDRYVEVKKYYKSLITSANAAMSTIKPTPSIILSSNGFISLVYIQIIVVLLLLE